MSIHTTDAIFFREAKAKPADAGDFVGVVLHRSESGSYVTHRYYRFAGSSKMETFWGHYFQDYDEALQEYKARSARDLAYY